MEECVENLCLDRVEVAESAAVELLESRIAEGLDRDGAQGQQASVWVVLIWHTDVRQLNVCIEAEVVPSVGDELDCVELTRVDVGLSLWNLVGHEEGQCECVIVLHATRASPWQSNVLLLKLEVLRVEHLVVIIDDDPEGLRLPVPPIVPVELSRDSQLHLENRACDGLSRDLGL